MFHANAASARSNTADDPPNSFPIPARIFRSPYFERRSEIRSREILDNVEDRGADRRAEKFEDSVSDSYNYQMAKLIGGECCTALNRSITSDTRFRGDKRFPFRREGEK